MAKMKCKCGNSYLIKVEVNEFYSSSTNLYTSLREIDVDRDVKIYQCLKCKEYILPPVDYLSAIDEDKTRYENLLKIVKGEEPNPEVKPRPKRTVPGEINFVPITSADPEHDGTIRQV